MSRSLRWRLAVVLLGLGAWAVPAVAVEGIAVDQEIERLLGRLADSGCDFERNGSWHSGEEARAHLLRKRDYFARRGEIHSSEQFIEVAATRSSRTDRVYRVRCGAAAPVESRDWLLGQLQALRQSAPPGQRGR